MGRLVNTSKNIIFFKCILRKQDGFRSKSCFGKIFGNFQNLLNYIFPFLIKAFLEVPQKYAVPYCPHPVPLSLRLIGRTPGLVGRTSRITDRLVVCTTSFKELGTCPMHVWQSSVWYIVGHVPKLRVGTVQLNNMLFVYVYTFILLPIHLFASKLNQHSYIPPSSEGGLHPEFDR